MFPQAYTSPSADKAYEVCSDAAAKLEENYKNEVTDEFTVPFVVTPDSNIKQGDSVIFFNFRPDRAREITRSLVDTDFDGFIRKDTNLLLNYVCFTQYDATMPNVEVAFKPRIETPLIGAAHLNTLLFMLTTVPAATL